MHREYFSPDHWLALKFYRGDQFILIIHSKHEAQDIQGTAFIPCACVPYSLSLPSIMNKFTIV